MVPNVDPNEWNEKCLNDVGKELLRRIQYMGQHMKVVPRE